MVAVRQVKGKVMGGEETKQMWGTKQSNLYRKSNTKINGSGSLDFHSISSSNNIYQLSIAAITF